jgi:uncharacterized protein (TIGR02266 family)
LTLREAQADTDWANVSSNAPVRVRLRYAAFDTFIEKFAPNVTRGGVFLASRTPLPVGSTFAFEIQLAGGEVALAGDGKVTWVKEFDPAAPQKAHGMGVQFMRLDAPSRDTLNRMLVRKAAGVVRPTGPGGGTGSHRTVTGPLPRVDTTVDLAAELGIDEARLRRTTDRHRISPGRAGGEMDELEALLRPEAPEPVTIAQALAELPRMIDPAARRMTGAIRMITATEASGPAPAPEPAVAAPVASISGDTDRTTP